MYKYTTLCVNLASALCVVVPQPYDQAASRKIKYHLGQTHLLRDPNDFITSQKMNDKHSS